ncbi:cys-loop ligand-gated ion channel-like [Haliotis rubra]|uniref:cys-loop ligand-gated ion channel-like n=1 Tax=Haliotis rubra TaxID=36100 RepID=UPI001EE633D3|nr:cys-loop ligand-gated ion channel-like [Haliotis rubra]
MTDRYVSLKIVFLKISNIDTIREEYLADIFLSARWREPALDNNKETQKINWESYFDPKLNIQNNIGELKQTTWRELQTEAGGETYVMERRRIKGKFFEKLELQDFPFDIQDLSILITSESPPTDVELVELNSTVSHVNVDSFVDQQEWGLYDFVVGEKRLMPNEYSSVKYKRPGFIFRCCAVRRVGYFTWNIMLVIAMISSLSFAAFSVDRELPQRRLQLSFTLILTMVTFKFVASQSVPKLSYLTYLDRYILLSMSFLFLVCCWHAVVALYKSDDDTAGMMDYYAFFAFVGVYLFGQVMFVVIVGTKKKLESLPTWDRPEKRKKKHKHFMKINPFT